MLFLIHVILTFWVSCAQGQERTCEFPEIKHGSLYDENIYKPTFPVAMGTYFYYICNHSFVSPSQTLWTRITCTVEGWAPTPKCHRQCFFPSVKNGHSVSSGQTHLEGDTVQIVCDTGFKLPNNQSNITCAEGGWSTPPKCSRIYSKGKCGPPPAIDNGDLTSFPQKEYAPGMSVEYQCQTYYVLQGNPHVTCRNGQWSEPPKCLEACIISGDIMNEHNIELKWTYNRKLYAKAEDIIEFRCKYGYKSKTPRYSFKAKCQEGTVIYPRCG